MKCHRIIMLHFECSLIFRCIFQLHITSKQITIHFCVYFLFFFLMYLFYLFLAVLGLHCCVQAFSSCGEWGLLFVVVCKLLVVASLVAEHGLQVHGLQQLQHAGSVVVACGLQSAGSVVVAHRFSFSVACGIFPDQGSNPCPLHWQADSYPLRRQGSPSPLLFSSLLFFLFNIYFIYLAAHSTVVSLETVHGR